MSEWDNRQTIRRQRTHRSVPKTPTAQPLDVADAAAVIAFRISAAMTSVMAGSGRNA
jgi:hypothetical protein